MSVSRKVLEGRWMQLRGIVRRQWGRLTDDDIDMIKGSDEELIGRIMIRYHCGRAEAERMFYEWAANL